LKKAKADEVAKAKADEEKKDYGNVKLIMNERLSIV